MEQSPTKEVATYIIDAHGTMLSSEFGDSVSPIITKKYHAITIPKNVELYTFNNLGKCVAPLGGEANIICDTFPNKSRLMLVKSTIPAFKFKHEHGTTNKFPELFLTPDKSKPVKFYSGITHCIPEQYRTSSSREKEIIYNIDAKNTKNCECSSVVSNSDFSPYDCDKKYSTYYKEQLEGYKYDPSAPNINKCGPLLLSEALVIIQVHSKFFYGSTCLIKVYILACLTETNLLTLVESIRKVYEKTEQRAKGNSSISCSTKKDSPIACSVLKPSPDKPKYDALETQLAQLLPPLNFGPSRPNEVELISSDKTSDEKKLDYDKLLSIIYSSTKDNKNPKIYNIVDKQQQKKMHLMEYYYEAMKHNTFDKVNFQNVVESLDDFKAELLTHPLFSTYTFVYKAKVFNIKTFKDAFIEFNEEHSKPFSGQYEEVITQLEKKYRAITKHKLDKHFREALHKFEKDDADDDDLYSDILPITALDILPKSNDINLAMPFNIRIASDPNNSSSFDLTELIYTQLLKLIALEKAKKLGLGRRRKTLHKRRKDPYAKNKSKHKAKNKSKHKSKNKAKHKSKRKNAIKKLI